VDRDSDEFVNLLTGAQPALYAHILAILPDRVAAQDILQETNLTLWHKAEDFESGTSFLAWAGRIARYHVQNYRRKQNRDRLVFDERLFDELSLRLADRPDDADRYVEPLRECLARLPAEHRELLACRYAAGGSVAEIAKSRGQSAGAVSQLLYRIREALLNCLSQRLQEGAL
jgi:RNA polymerase sigma-70 factor, ECF subfamily